MNPLQLFTRVEGRIPRQTYWLGILAITVVGLPTIAAAAYLFGGTAGAIANLFFLWCGFALSVKRAQDRNRHYLFVAAYFVLVAVVTNLTASQSKMMGSMAAEQQPIVIVASLVFLAYVVFLFIELGLRRGTVGPNQYGPDPIVETQPQPSQS
jgi:uncharacterized membrane protein YhaH (DUF805 family)